MIHELSTQSTGTTQRDLCLEDFIGLYEMASHSNLPHTGHFTQPQYGGDGSWGMDPTLDNFHPAKNIPDNHIYGSANTSHENSFRAENMPQDHTPHRSTYPLCAIVDRQRSQIMPSLPEIFEPLSSPYTSSTSLRPAAASPQQTADTMISHGRMILSQDGNHQLDIKLRHDDTVSFYALAIPQDKGTAHVFQLVGPKDMVPVINCLPNGVRSVSWKKF